MVVLLGAGAAYYYWQQNQRSQPQEPAPLGMPEPPSQAASQAEAEPAIRYPIDTPVADPAKPLPTLENSDAMMRDLVTELVGRKAFETFMRPAQIIRHVVATVDNLPRETAPAQVMPLEPVPGRFSVLPAGDEATLGAANAARYTPYVRVFEALDARVLVQRYIESYPLFQKAYAELGFPNRNFNDRLVEAIDNLLAAPQVSSPVKLVRPKVLYQFADPDLEARSAGQKIMMRMGSDNAAKVKAKLREIRRELTAPR
jgi:hypothetical protein